MKVAVDGEQRDWDRAKGFREGMNLVLTEAKSQVWDIKKQVPAELTWPFCFPVVVPFTDVWNRSFCRPIQKLVDIMDEYPDEVAHLFRPSCVLLSRCSGCCGDESLQCVPLKKANITMQVGKLFPPCHLLSTAHTISRCQQNP